MLQRPGTYDPPCPLPAPRRIGHVGRREVTPGHASAPVSRPTERPTEAVKQEARFSSVVRG